MPDLMQGPGCMLGGESEVHSQGCAYLSLGKSLDYNGPVKVGVSPYIFHPVILGINWPGLIQLASR